MWYWDGHSWRYSIAPRHERPGMFWFFSAPDWAAHFVLTGLIGLIPIVGAINLLSWYLASRDNLRSGYWIVPKAGFEYLERGLRVFVVHLLYTLFTWLVYIFLGLAILVAVLAGAPAVGVVSLVVALIATYVAALLTLGFLAAAMMSVADWEGIGAALNPARIWRVAVANPGPSWRVFGAYVLGYSIAYGIGLMGIFLPFGLVPMFLILPAAYLLAAPAQAEFNETALAAQFGHRWTT